jgi:hypothetical protein
MLTEGNGILPLEDLFADLTATPKVRVGIYSDGIPAIVDEDGHLTVHDAGNGLSIAQGDISNTTFVHKFGNAPDFDTADNEVTIWDGAEDGTAWELMVYQYSTTADIDSISSSDNGDTVQIAIQGLDTNYNLVNMMVTLNGQTRVALPKSLLRVFRAYNNNSTNLAGHVIIYVNTALTAGVPTDKTKIRAIVDPVNQQTEMAIYTVPNGKTAYLRSWYAATAGANKNSNYTIKLRTREQGKVFRVKHVSAISDVGTSAYNHRYHEPEIMQAKTDIEMTAIMQAVGGTNASISAGFDIVLVDSGSPETASSSSSSSSSSGA